MIRRLLWQQALWTHGVRRVWEERALFAGLSPAHARRHLAERLQAQVQYFGSRGDALPEWRAAARLADPEQVFEAWSSLPILTKDDLNTRFPPEEVAARFNVRGRIGATGGSTGEPTRFLHDPRMSSVLRAAALYCWWSMGWKPGMPVICVWGSERDIGKQRSRRSRLKARAENLWIVDGYGLDHQTVDAVLALVRRHRSAAMYGFTSMLEFVAREALQRGDTGAPGRVTVAWNGGEMLFDEQSRLFQAAFGVPILSLYGGRELSAMAYQSEALGPLHVLRPWLLLEIVDETGRPVGPGETGRLIWTSTICRGTPFLRYDIGDVGSYGPNDRDQSGIARIAELRGRRAGLLTLPNGRTINCLYWNHLLKDFPEVEQFQVALVAHHSLECRFKGVPFTVERENQFRSVLGGFVGGTPVSIRWMDRIPRTQEGKLVQVLQE